MISAMGLFFSFIVAVFSPFVCFFVEEVGGVNEFTYMLGDPKPLAWL